MYSTNCINVHILQRKGHHPKSILKQSYIVDKDMMPSHQDLWGNRKNMSYIFKLIKSYK